MAGPARAGALIYAHDLTRLTAFYETFLAMRRAHEGDGYVVLESGDAQLVIHAIPAHIAATFTIASPPEVREDGAIKLFFAVPSLAAAEAAAPALGGAVFGPEYSAGVFRARNAYDPEGNIIQVREFEPTPAAD